MIARIIIPLLLAVLLPQVYVDLHFFRRRFHLRWWKRILGWLPTVAVTGYCIWMATFRDFVPDNMIWLEIFYILLTLVILPKFLFVVCSCAGWLWCIMSRTHRNWGNIIGPFFSVLGIAFFWYGFTHGESKLVVRHVNLTVDGLPKSFDGFRITQFSDLHIGTYKGWRRKILTRDIDSINAQRSDIIVFTGDLQNVKPQELIHFQKELSSLRAPDGVFSVLGNHDYSLYQKGEAENAKRNNERLTCRLQEQVGWKLLTDAHATVRRGGDSIVIVGTHNDGKPPLPSKINIKKAMSSIAKEAFVIMLQHDPSSWERTILPHTNACLTLSGHTHAGQVELFGLRPTMLTYKQDYGLFEKEGRFLYVSAGLGGVVPIRIGAVPEIVVFTLHSK
ncbi:metallophosphoesterase [Prevotella sp.]|uniref:metallophosphoesterase n=1 Tax=Prevotella sp. TaxID=59823 RepID=UPI002F94DAAE